MWDCDSKRLEKGPNMEQVQDQLELRNAALVPWLSTIGDTKTTRAYVEKSTEV